MKTLGFIIALVLSWVGCQAQIVTIPDANFKAYLVGDPFINTNGDTEIQVSEAQAATGINITGVNASDLTGIEMFTGMGFFVCDNNILTSGIVDLSNSPNMQVVRATNSQLQQIILPSTPTGLTEMTCHGNNLTSLDLSGATALQTLACANNQLTTLRVNSTALTNITCQNNQIDTLDLSTCTNIDQVNCRYNGMRSLTFPTPNTTFMTEVLCDHNQLTALMLPTINRLDCGNNLLTSLIVRNGSSVRCDSNQLTNFRAIASTIDTLVFYHNNLDTLDLSTDISYLDGSHNQLRYLLCRSNTLKDIILNDNQLQLLYFTRSLQNTITNSTFNALNNPDLWCVALDNTADVTYARANWTNADHYNNGLLYNLRTPCDPIWTDITEVKSVSTLKVYPNPAKETVQIELDQLEAEITVNIYNPLGQLCHNQVFYSTSSFTLNLPPTKGLYVVVLQTPEGQQSLLVQKE